MFVFTNIIRKKRSKPLNLDRKPTIFLPKILKI